MNSPDIAPSDADLRSTPAPLAVALRFPLYIILLALLSSCGGREQLTVREMAPVDYPIEARDRNIQGRVSVDLLIGPDGKVEWAKGKGGPEILVKAAERSARQWVFGPFPPEGQFPISHTVVFVYKLEGEPLYTVTEPTIYTHLPDRVDIVGTPYEEDNPIPPKTPSPKDDNKKEPH